MATDRFRQELRQEAEQWQADGLIDAAQYQELAQRYQFDRLEATARDRFIAIIITVGSLLVGISVITFVAANWQAIPRLAKLLLLIVVFVGVNSGGFYLWRSPVSSTSDSTLETEPRERWQQRLGVGFLVLGQLILGANLALTGQMFQIGGSGSELCLLWSLAVLVMAYGLRLAPLSILATVLMGIGYWLGFGGFGNFALSGGWRLWWNFMPVVSIALFIPLAYRCRSKVTFAIAMIALVTSLIARYELFGSGYRSINGWDQALLVGLPIAFLWSYAGLPWQSMILRRSPVRQTVESDTNRTLAIDLESAFQSIAQTLARVCLSIVLYLWSFHYFWDASVERSPATSPQIMLDPNIWIVLLMTLVQWVYLARPVQRSGQVARRWGWQAADGFVLFLVGAIAMLLIVHWSVTPIMVFATFVLNILLFLLATYFLREGLSSGQRPLFWSGMILLTLQILSRVLEYDTDLLFKSLVFLLWGIAMIVVGLWFERRLRSLRRSV